MKNKLLNVSLAKIGRVDAESMRVFPWRKSEESMRNRCAVTFQPSDYQNNTISMYNLLERQLVTTAIVANLDPNHHAAIGLALALAFALPIGRDPRTG